MGDRCETNVCKSAGTPTSDCFGFVTSARSLSARKEIWRLSSTNESSTSRRLVTALPSPARYHRMHHHLSSLSHHAAPWLSKTTSAAHLKTMVDFRPGFLAGIRKYLGCPRLPQVWCLLSPHRHADKSSYQQLTFLFPFFPKNPPNPACAL